MGWQDDPVVTPAGSSRRRWQDDPIVGDPNGPLVMDARAFDRLESAPPPPPSFWERAGHSLALGTRNVIEGTVGAVYDVAGLATNLGIRGLNALGADLPYVKSSSEYMDNLGMAQPQNDTERLIGAGVRAASSMMLGGPGAMTARNVGMAAAGGVAGEETYQQTGNPYLAMLVDAGVNLGPTAGSAAKRMIERGGEITPAMRDSAADFARVGVDPTSSQITGNTLTRGAESILSGTPGGSGVMRAASARQNAQFGDKLSEIAAGETSDSAGRAMQAGIKGFVDRFKARSASLYDAVDRHIAPTTAADISNTQAALAKLVNPVPGAPAVGEVLRNPKLVQLEEALRVTAGNGGTVPYAALKAVRSSVGEMLSGSELVSGAPRAQIKMLYSALSDDMAAAASAAGPDATHALNRANQFYKSGLGRIEGSLERLSKIEDPERLANALARGDVTTLLAARRSVTPDEWLTVARAQAGRLALAKAGQQNAAGTATSAETFLTNFNNLGKRAQDVMFAALPGNPRMADDLRTLAKVADEIRRSNRTLANPSGTAAMTAHISAGGLFLGSLMYGKPWVAGKVALGALGANRAATILTDPRKVRLLTQATNWPKERFPALVARMAQLDQNDKNNEGDK